MENSPNRMETRSSEFTTIRFSSYSDRVPRVRVSAVLKEPTVVPTARCGSAWRLAVAAEGRVGEAPLEEVLVEQVDQREGVGLVIEELVAVEEC